MLFYLLKAAGQGVSNSTSEDSWQAMVSKKYGQSVEFAKTLSHQLRTHSLLIVHECLRAVVAFFLKASKEGFGDRVCAINVLDVLHEQYSPVTLATQQLRYIGAGTAPRVRLLIGLVDADNFSKFAECQPEAALEHIAMCRATSAALHKRVKKELDQQPLAGLRFLDGRRSEEERRELAASVCAPRRPCCRGRFWSRLLANDLRNPGVPVTPIRLFSDEWKPVLGALLRVIDNALSIAALERRNKRTKVILSQPDVRNKTLIAKSINQEMHVNYESRHVLDTNVLAQFSPPRRGRTCALADIHKA